jgi:hypothetical protein
LLVLKPNRAILALRAPLDDDDDDEELDTL